MNRDKLAGLALALAMALLLVGCSSSAAEPTAAPTAEPTQRAAEALGMFTGHDTCAEDPADTNPDDDATLVTCDRVTTDPRLTGTFEGIAHPCGDPDEGVGCIYGTFRGTNDGGGWSCDELTLGSGDNGVGWKAQACVGEGGYAGLTAYVHAITGNLMGDFGILGWVEEMP